LAWPVALVHGDLGVAECRSRKHQRVEEGVKQLLKLQGNCRTALGDLYFACWSFCAEEEFYLLVLPILFWNVDYRFARQMNFVVSSGLLWGNLLKDAFRLPRPRNVEPKVWVPHSVVEVDSTACRDFGFPSTHAMNSVSNSLFTVLYCLQYGVVSGVAGYAAMLFCMCLWIFSIAFGRLYLGVHSPMDVKGGLLQGLALALLAQRPLYLCDVIDRFLLATPHVGALLLLLFAVVLVLHPQPRPLTPTFLQNCTVSGVFFGCAVGYRMETDRRRASGSHSMHSSDVGVAGAVARTIVGFVLLVILRMVLKQVLTSGFQLIGLHPNPPKVRRKEAKELVKRQEIKGWDLWAAAVSKFLVYAALAWGIVCVALLSSTWCLACPVR